MHPLDNGLIDRRAQARDLAAKHGIAARVRCVDGGHLPTLVIASKGVVVVNSTVGLGSIEFGRSTVALGTSIYDIPGLSYQGGLDRFWTEVTPPDPELVAAFRKLLVHRTQVNGGFFCTPGVALAVENAASRLEAEDPLLLYRPADAAGADRPRSDVYGRPLPAE